MVENFGPGTYGLDLDDFPEDTDEDAVAYNAGLLIEAGLLNGQIMLSGSVIAQGLTWKGREFLDAARNDTIWNKAKSIAIEKTGGLSFSVVTDLLLELAKRAALSVFGG